MKKLLISFAMISVSAFAQTLSLTCPANVKAGSPLNVTVSITNNQGMAAWGYTATATPALTGMLAISAGSALGALKGVSVSGSSVLQGGLGPPPPTTLNNSLIPDGPVTLLTWQVPASLANQTITISLAGGAFPPNASSASGSAIPLTAGPSCAVPVLPSVNFCDLNGDGVVNQADATAEVALILTFPQSAKCARDSTGCGATAAEIVINAALGGKCTATQ